MVVMDWIIRQPTRVAFGLGNTAVRNLEIETNASGIILGDGITDGVTLPLTTGNEAGLMAPTDKTKLTGLQNTLVTTEPANFQTRAQVVATNITDTQVQHLRTAGYLTTGDGGGGLYRRATAEPDHDGKIQSADGAWWELVAPNGVSAKQLGAVADGNANDQPQVAAARVVGGAVDLSADTYYFGSQEVIQGAGIHIRGQGKDRTRIICDAGGEAGIVFRNALHCGVSNLTIQGNDLSAPGIQLEEVAGNTISNVFDNVRFIGNSGGGQPNVDYTNHSAVRGIGAAAGRSNYFNRFTNCDFDSWHTAFHGDYNANAWYVKDAKAQAVWRFFRGGMQQWMCTGLFWHSSPGNSENATIFAELSGSSPTNRGQFNQFVNIVAEPGTNMTQFVALDEDTLGNMFDGDHQCSTHGTDLGVNNHFRRTTVGRYESGSSYSWRYTEDMTFGFTGGAGDVNFFGNGATSYTGQPRVVRVFGGFAAEGRHGRIEQSGDFTISSVIAGDLSLRHAGQLKLPDLPVYDDNAEARSNGMTPGQVYRTSDGALRICI